MLSISLHCILYPEASSTLSQETTADVHVIADILTLLGAADAATRTHKEAYTIFLNIQPHTNMHVRS